MLLDGNGYVREESGKDSYDIKWTRCISFLCLGKDDPLGLRVRVFVCVSEREVEQHNPSAVLGNNDPRPSSHSMAFRTHTSI